MTPCDPNGRRVRSSRPRATPGVNAARILPAKDSHDRLNPFGAEEYLHRL